MDNILKVLDEKLAEKDAAIKSLESHVEHYEHLLRERDRDAQNQEKNFSYAKSCVFRTQEIMKEITQLVPWEAMEALHDSAEYKRNVRMFYDRAQKPWLNW